MRGKTKQLRLQESANDFRARLYQQAIENRLNAYKNRFTVQVDDLTVVMAYSRDPYMCMDWKILKTSHLIQLIRIRIQFVGSRTIIFSLCQR